MMLIEIIPWSRRKKARGAHLSKLRGQSSGMASGRIAGFWLLHIFQKTSGSGMIGTGKQPNRPEFDKELKTVENQSHADRTAGFVPQSDDDGLPGVIGGGESAGKLRSIRHRSYERRTRLH